MNEGEMRMERIERAMRATFRESARADGTPSEAVVERIMLRVRAQVRLGRQDAPGDARFLWRFVSASAVAAGVLVAVALTNVPAEYVSLNPPSDDMVATVLNPTMPF